MRPHLTRAVVPVVALLAAGLAAGIASPAATAAPAPRTGLGTAAAAGQTPAPARYEDVASAAAAASAAPRGPAPAVAPQAKRNGLAHVVVTGDQAGVAARVAALGGRVLTAANGQSSALVPAAEVGTLARAPGITRVAGAETPVRNDVTSEGVAASHANLWQAAGNAGAGVDIAVVDAGFGATKAEYDGEVAAGRLGTSPTLINQDCVDQGGASTPYDDPHGLAVAEIVHQMAPGARLFLYCVNTSVAVNRAEADIEARHIRLVSSSLGWPGDSRGDGTGPVNSVAAAVARARQHGILWIESAGNDVPFHYGGIMRDANGDDYLDLGNSDPNAYPYESNFYTISGGASGAPTGATIFFQYDLWPASTLPIRLEAYGVQCTAGFGSGGFDDCQGVSINPDANGYPTPVVATQGYGDTPVLKIDTTSNTLPFAQVWQVAVHTDTAFPALRFDLTGYGDFAAASDLSCPKSDGSGQCVFGPAATINSVSAPANSPYAMAVGAASAGGNPAGPPAGTLEYFSSQGPTIDGRIKPDITGWDNVRTNVAEFPYFFGTSAAAPHVAGAAALVMGLHPGWDPAQVQTYLETQANNGAAQFPGLITTGHGLLTLGAAAASQLPAGSGFAPLPKPTRILADRHLGQAGSMTLAMPANLVPANATAVAISLNGVDLFGVSTYVSVYPGNTAYPGVSSLNLSATDRQAQAFVAVPLNQHAIQIRNAFGAVSVYVDLLGYFSPTAAGKYTADTGIRLANTQGNPLTDGAHLTVGTRGVVPASATTVVVNVQAFNQSAPGYLSVSAAGAPGTSNLVYLGLPRSNLAVTALTAAGTFQVALRHGSADVLVDLVGYFGPTGSSYVPLPSPVRVVNSQFGNNAPYAPVPDQGVITSRATGFLEIPAAATGLLADVLALETGGAPSYLTLYPGSDRPRVSTVNFTNGRQVSNVAIIAPDPSGMTHIYNRSGHTDVYIDAFGYFLPG